MNHRLGIRILSWMLGLALVVSVAAPSVLAQGEDSEKIYQRTLKGTVWILVPKAGNRTASGTGFLVDKSRKLVITNYHVAGDTGGQVAVVFPEFSKNKPVAERSHYMNVAKRGGAIRGKVLHSDTRRDLAIIELDKVPVGAQAVKLSRDGAGPAQAVHSIGNPGRSDLLWEYTSGTVRQIGRKAWKVRDGDRLLEFEAKVVEAQTPTNPGDSGGPLVNNKGELVGVTQGIAIDAQSLSLFIDVSEVRSFLASKKLLPRVGATEVASAETKPKPSGGTSDEEDTDKAEKDAARKLGLAKTLESDGKIEKAKDRYEAIIASYPNTKAAGEAKLLLERLSK